MNGLLTVTLPGVVSLAFAMAVLAAVPSISVLTVVARTMGHGFAHGAATAAGVVLGDVAFILLALFGLALLAELIGPGFRLVGYLGAIYLVWLAFRLWRSRPVGGLAAADGGASLPGSLFSGLLITLGDQKAILFYFVFLQAFVDVATVTLLDAAVIVLTAVVTVGGVKILYAWFGVGLARGGPPMLLNRVAALILVAAAVLLLLRA